jgi:hypothetical protein
VLHCPGVATTELWYLDPEKAVVDRWQVSQAMAIGMWFAGLPTAVEPL